MLRNLNVTNFKHRKLFSLLPRFLNFSNRKMVSVNMQIKRSIAFSKMYKSVPKRLTVCSYLENSWEMPLRKRFPYSELLWSALSPHFSSFGLNTERYSASLSIQSECGKRGKNADQNNSEYGHFLLSVLEWFKDLV